MNRTLLAMVFIAFLAAAKHVAAQTGSADAARAIVLEFLAKTYTVVEMPVIIGNKATVNATLVDLHCALNLVRHATANPSGWVVEKVVCNK
jgi:hypothetical protein